MLRFRTTSSSDVFQTYRNSSTINLRSNLLVIKFQSQFISIRTNEDSGFYHQSLNHWDSQLQKVGIFSRKSWFYPSSLGWFTLHVPWQENTNSYCCDLKRRANDQQSFSLSWLILTMLIHNSISVNRVQVMNWQRPNDHDRPVSITVESLSVTEGKW